MKCTYITSTSFTELTLFFQNVSFVFNTIFRLVCETLHVGRINLYAGKSELLTHAVFQLDVFRKNGVFGVHPSAGLKCGSRRVLNRDCREDEGDQIEGADF